MIVAGARSVPIQFNRISDPSRGQSVTAFGAGAPTVPGLVLLHKLKG
jgi:hypothetical protein